MSQFEHRSSSTVSVSWHAHREAQQLDDVTMARELDSYIRDNPTARRRSAAYFIIGAVGKNCRSAECAEILIAQIRVEKDRFALSLLLRALADVPKTEQVDLAPVLGLLNDKRWAIRHQAIASLINTYSTEVEDRVLDVLRSSTDPRDAVSCHATLNRIGTTKALPALEAGLKSRKRDVRISAAAAIAAIGERASTHDQLSIDPT
jgi:HEAT repeat protein